MYYNTKDIKCQLLSDICEKTEKQHKNNTATQQFSQVCCPSWGKYVTIFSRCKMITIYKSNSMKDAAAYITKVLKSVDQSNLDVVRTVIVPDRASMEAERALLKAVGGSFNIRVRTFRRLANEILPKFDYLSKQSGIMALTGIIQDVKTQLTCYTKGVNTPGFVADMYDTISTMKYCRISPDDLLKENLPKGVRGKAHDIAVIYKAYMDYTKDAFVDSADKLDLFCSEIPRSKACDGYFYLYDFDNLSVQELAVVEQLMLCSRGVTVACCVGEKPADGYLYLNDIYQGVLAVCKKNNIVPTVVEGMSYVNKYTRQIGENLFRYLQVSPVEADDFVEIFRGETRVQEVYALACRIQRYVRRGGRFKDVYVVTSDVNKYYNAVATVFDELQIPYFCDRQFVLGNHPYATFITDYIALCKSNGRLDFVLPFVKNHLFCGSFDVNGNVDENVFHFENYCLKYNVSHNYNPFTLGKTETYFANAEAFRQKFFQLFQKVKFPSSATAEQFVATVRTLVETTQLNERNVAFAQQQQAFGLSFESKVTLQAQEKFEEVLSQAERVLHGRYLQLEDFLRILTAALASVKISVLPVTNDCVVFANMAKARKHDIVFLALLGANYGAMPIVKSDCKLLSDRNIQDLAASGIFVEPQIFVENKRERFSLFQLLLEPSKHLYVSYAEADGANALTPSPFVGELQNMFTQKGQPLSLVQQADEEVYTTKQAISKIVSGKRRLQDNQQVKTPSFSVLQKHLGAQAEKFAFFKTCHVRVENGKQFYLDNSETSVSKLTDFYKCPYRFYLEYGLRVKPRSVAELQASDLGNILHEVLENYVRKANLDESDAQTNDVASKCFADAISDDYYTAMKTNAQLVGMLEQLKAEALRMCRVVKKQLKESCFSNMATELAFGTKEDLPPVEVDYGDGKFLLIGKIDRVDVDDGKFIVIDYKSGATAASYTEKDLYLGHKLQLLVYVKAVQTVYGYQPAGFYYFNMHNNFTEADNSKVYVYNGRTLDDAEVACRLDVNLSQSQKSEKLGLSLNADGSLSRRGNKLLSANQFENQVRYAIEMIEQAGKLMLQGFADVSPYKHCCDYCDYKDVCDFGDVLTEGEREVEVSVSAEDIDDTVEKCQKISQQRNKT